MSGYGDSESCSEHRRLFDPLGLLLVGIVGGGGVFILLRHGWILGVICVVLASLGLITSHRHFGPRAENE